MTQYLIAIQHPDGYDGSKEDEPMSRDTDGPYLGTKEHVDGFWVLEAADKDEALAWGQKAAVACRVPVEVRPFH